MKIFLFIICTLVFFACNYDNTSNRAIQNQALIDKGENSYIAFFAKECPTIDGYSDEKCWDMAYWDTLKYNWIGPDYTATDFSGKYKISWCDSMLYLLVEIEDDKLQDTHIDPTQNYWDDDCLEVFIDEDKSGGDHQYNHSSFAYHISPLMNVLDIGNKKHPIMLNSHINGAIMMEKNTFTWELAIVIYDHTFNEQNKTNTKSKLSKDKVMGFSLAYCDSDSTTKRENFIGSVNTEGHFNDQGWINANCFGTLVLK